MRPEHLSGNNARREFLQLHAALGGDLATFPVPLVHGGNRHMKQRGQCRLAFLLSSILRAGRIDQPLSDSTSYYDGFERFFHDLKYKLLL